MTSLRALYGRDSPTLRQPVEEPFIVEEVNSHIKEQNVMTDELKTSLTKAQVKV